MVQVKPKGKQVDITSIASDIAANPTAIGSIATGVTTDPSAAAILDLDYLRRDGTGAMTASLNMGNFDITSVVNVAGRNVAGDGVVLDNHLASLAPHRIINDSAAVVTELWSALKISNELGLKADKVIAGTTGNLVELDATGNYVDSGSSISSFAAASHTHASTDITDFGTAVTAEINVNSIGELSDVDVATNAPVNDDILRFTGGEWLPDVLVEADITDLQLYLLDITSESIVDLSDVFSSMVPVDGQVLTFDTTNGWQSEALPSAPVTSVAGKTGVVTLVEADITDLGTTVAPIATPSFAGTVGFPTYTVGTLPAQAAGHQIYVSDATGSGVTGSMCFSNGTVWVDVTTGIAVV